MVKMFRKDITQEEKDKQLQQGFLYFHELNYDVITNKYFDWNSPAQYSIKTAKDGIFALLVSLLHVNNCKVTVIRNFKLL